LFAGSSAIAGDLAGTVVGVIDGDTIDVLVEGRAVRVRLAEIDAPERRQAFGSKAKRELSA
jgi:endonuclease YncB( thermonuclease family)